MLEMKLKKYSKTILLTVFSIVLMVMATQSNFAQSTDPDNPAVLNGGTISAINTGNLSDDKTFYYAFEVTKGTLEWTLDLTPTNKSDAGGVLQWTLLTPKFEKLKYDNLTAQVSPERQIKDLPVTIKRRIILKIVVSGNVSYKIKITGSAVNRGTKK